MRLRLVVDAEVSFTSGKFASRAEVEDELLSALEGADPGSVSAGEGEYEVDAWDVSSEDPPARPRRVRR